MTDRLFIYATRSSRLLIGVGLLLVAMFVTACDQMGRYKATVRSGMSVLPWPGQIKALFGDTDDFITHYGFDAKPKQWNTEVFFGGRYVLTLQVYVEINYSKNIVIRSVSPPEFYLKEIKDLVYDSAGNIVGASFQEDWKFDEVQWSKLVAAHGDWSVIGISVRNDPIPDFDKYAELWRAPRVQVK